MEVTNTTDTGKWIKLDTGYTINLQYVKSINPPAGSDTFFNITFPIGEGRGATFKQMYSDNAQAVAAYNLLVAALEEFVTVKIMPILTTTPTIVSVDVNDWTSTGDVEVTGTDLAAPGTLQLIDGTGKVWEANTPDSVNQSSAGNTVFKTKVWLPTPPSGTYDVKYVNKTTGQFVVDAAAVVIP